MDNNKLLTFGSIGGFVLLMLSGWFLALLCLTVVGLLLLREYLQGGKFYSRQRLDGKVVVITGGNTGIGKETAKDLSKRGAKVIIGCRNMEKAHQAAQEIKDETNNPVIVHQLDLTSFKSVREFAKAVTSSEDRIDILINNAGVMMCPKWTTSDGNEMQFQTNHLGHFLLTNLLLPTLKKSTPARIVNVSSLAHTWCKNIPWEDLNFDANYSAGKAYALSKTANVLFTKELANRLKGTGVTTYSLHPGTINTELSRHIESSLPSIVNAFGFIVTFFLKTPINGAQTSIYCAVEKAIEKDSGKYYSDCKESKPSPLTEDKSNQDKMWKISEKLVGLLDGKSDDDIEQKQEQVTKVEKEVLQSKPEVETKHHLEKKESSSSSSSESEDEEAIIENTVQGMLSSAPEKETHVEVLGSGLEIEEKVKEEESSDDDDDDQLTESSRDAKEETKAEEPKVEILEPVEVSSHHKEEVQELVEEEVQPRVAICVRGEPPLPVDPSSDSEDEQIAKDDVRESKTEIEKVENVPSRASDPSPVVEDEILEEIILESKSVKKDLSTQFVEKEPESSSSSSSSSSSDSEDDHELKPADTVDKPVDSQSVDKKLDFQDEISSFDRKILKSVETKEEITLPDANVISIEKTTILQETEKNKEVFESVKAEVCSFTSTVLKKVETEEHVFLPDKYEIMMEKSTESLLKEVQAFSPAELTHVKPHETNPVEMMARRESLKSGIEGFERSRLKSTETLEDNWIPTSEVIESEREVVKQEIIHQKEVFTEVVKTLEENFEETKEGLKHVEVETKTHLPDKIELAVEKSHAQLLALVPEAQLTPAKETREYSAFEFAKTEYTRSATLEQVSAFDKQVLKPTCTEEKVILPDQNVISQEKNLEASTGQQPDLTKAQKEHGLLLGDGDKSSDTGTSGSERSRNSSSDSDKKTSSEEWEKIEKTTI